MTAPDADLPPMSADAAEVTPEMRAKWRADALWWNWLESTDAADLRAALGDADGSEERG